MKGDDDEGESFGSMPTWGRNAARFRGVSFGRANGGGNSKNDDEDEGDYGPPRQGDGDEEEDFDDGEEEEEEISRSQTMETYDVRGVQVAFPYTAYDSQRVYMERVIQSLQESKNALLESPTGTGKTLCLLCASLAWRQQWQSHTETSRNEALQGDYKSSNGETPLQPLLFSGGGDMPLVVREKPPRIIYTSRTHSQLTQVMKELKRTAYSPRTTVLGSRRQLCINPDVVTAPNRDHKCRSLITRKGCEYYNKLDEYKKGDQLRSSCTGAFAADIDQEELTDIEEIIRSGRDRGLCPFYLARELQYSADMIFAPYNYLIDPAIRRSLGVDLRGAVVIFDEAHNVESVCEESSSFDLKVSDLKVAIKELERAIEIVSTPSYSGDSSKDDIIRFKGMVWNLINAINNVSISGDGLSRPGDYIYDLLREVDINADTSQVIIQLCDGVLADLANDEESGMGLKPLSLKALNDCFKTLFKDGVDRRSDFSLYYKIHVHDQASAAQRGAFRFQSRNAERVVSCWCFNPGLAMLELAAQGVRNIILTSGTLSPLASTAAELKIPFPIRLENSHVIKPSQVWVGVLTSGPSNYPLNSSFKTRANEEYKAALGNALINFMRIVPNGLLVFFPSYTALTTCIDAWKRPDEQSRSGGTIWERMCKFKQPIIEPREAFQFKMAMEDYYAKVKEDNGAVFFAVCRGKVSEGLDFSDDNGRAVVITGLPYPSLTDAKVQQKRNYLDNQRQILGPSNSALTGSDWYSQQAMRAVNQAVGRVIRHSQDYGAIILADQRFGMGNCQGGLSLWLRPQIKIYNKFGEAALSLTRFFKNQAALPKPLPPAKKAFKEPSPPAQTSAVSTLPCRPAGLRSPTKFVPPRGASTTTSPHKSPVQPRTGIKRERPDEPLHKPRKSDELESPAKKEKVPEPTVSANEAQSYIRRVKSSLSATEYKAFQTTLRDFRSKQIDLSTLMQSVQQIFGGAERYALLRDFVAFVPPRHQADYLAMLPARTPSCPSSVKSYSVNAGPQAEPPSGVKSKETQVQQQSEKPPESERATKSMASYDLVTGSPCKPVRRPFVSPLIRQPNLTPAEPQPPASTSDVPRSCASTVPAAAAPHAPLSDGSTCPICQESPTSPFISKCKHVCCYGCWKQWLDQKLECPVCKQRVRLKHLTKLYFAP